jgi:sugar/nucleoside kinase (ribokinase family)
MFDITLYGHLTNDTIFEGQSETMALGGIANCWKAIHSIDSNLDIGLSPTALGEANIYIERKQCKRSSIANLNKEVFEPHIKPSRISHVLYLNELPDTSFIEKLSGITSADLCAGKEVDYSLLQYFDYVFVSDDEHDVQKIRDYSDGIVIAHSPDGSVVTGNNLKHGITYKVHDILRVPNANVLGAGDFFATAFLYAIHKRWSLENAIEYAHHTTSDLIRKYNEEV